MDAFVDIDIELAQLEGDEFALTLPSLVGPIDPEILPLGTEYTVLYEDQLDPFFDAYIEALLDQVEAQTGDTLDYDKVLFTEDNILVSGSRTGRSGSGGGISLVGYFIDSGIFTNFDYFNQENFVGPDDNNDDDEEDEVVATGTIIRDDSITLIASSGSTLIAVAPLDDGGLGIDIAELIHQLECVIEAAIDAAAKTVETAIMDNADSSTNEYGSVVYTDSEGVLQFVTPGTSNDPDNFSITLPTGVNESQIHAIIHNHNPATREDTDPNTPGIQDPAADFADAANRYPSPGDWQQLRDLVSAGANPDTLSTYIIGPDGIMREYNYSDMDIYDVDIKQLAGVDGFPPPPLLPDGIDDNQESCS